MCQLAHDARRVVEKSTASPNAVVAAILVIVAGGDKNLLRGISLAQFQHQELHGLQHEFSIMVAIAVMRCTLELLRKSMCQAVAGNQNEGGMGNRIVHLIKRRLQQPPIGVLPVLAECRRLRAVQDGLPLCRSGFIELGDQGRVGHGIEVKVRNHQESIRRGRLSVARRAQVDTATGDEKQQSGFPGIDCASRLPNVCTRQQSFPVVGASFCCDSGNSGNRLTSGTSPGARRLLASR